MGDTTSTTSAAASAALGTFATSNLFTKTLLVVSFCAIIFIIAASGALVVRAFLFHRRTIRDAEAQSFEPVVYSQPAACLNSTQEARNASMQNSIVTNSAHSNSTWTRYIPKFKSKPKEGPTRTSTIDILSQAAPSAITESSTESSMGIDKPWLMQDAQVNDAAQFSALKFSPSHDFRSHTVGLGISFPSPRLSIDLSGTSFAMAGNGGIPDSSCDTPEVPPVIHVAKPGPSYQLQRQSLRRAIPYIVVETCNSASSISSMSPTNESPRTPSQTPSKSSFPHVVGSGSSYNTFRNNSAISSK